jgi:hypothetical protein
MRKLLRHRPSPAMGVALLALFVALGGTGYAALQLPKNSVGTRQLRRNAVTSAKVKNGSLHASDFKSSSLPAGARGPQGPKGEPGQNGAPATRLFATVSGDGSQKTGTATSASRVAMGLYNVSFPADISGCTALVTAGSNPGVAGAGAVEGGTSYAVIVGSKYISPAMAQADPKSLRIDFYDSLGEGTTANAVDTSFNVAVFC